MYQKGELTKEGTRGEIGRIKNDFATFEEEGMQTVEIEDFGTTIDELRKESEKLQEQFPVGSSVLVARRLAEGVAHKEGVIIKYTLDTITQSVYSRVDIQWKNGGCSNVRIGNLKHSTLLQENIDPVAAILESIRGRVEILTTQLLTEKSRNAVVDITRDRQRIITAIMKKVRATKNNKTANLLNMSDAEILRRAEDIFNDRK